jgi:N-acetylated-alpha-linked acidic dipeptidase
LTRDEGLPRRPWFKHLVYAPGFYTGYGVKTLPGIREAIEERKWDEASVQTEAAGRALDRYAEEIEKATEILRAAAKN